MVFAQITQNEVVSTFVLDDITLLYLFLCDPVSQEPFDLVLQVDTIYPQPGIGWTFDNVQWNPPSTSDDDDGN